MRHDGVALLDKANDTIGILLPLEAFLIWYNSNLVANVAVVLLAGLLGLVLVHDWPGLLFVLLGPALWLAGFLALRRRHRRQQVGLKRALSKKGLHACRAKQGDKRFYMTKNLGNLTLPLTQTMPLSLAVNVLVARSSWVVLAKLEGEVLPATWWRHAHYQGVLKECTEVYLRQISHVSIEYDRLILHTTGGKDVEVACEDFEKRSLAMDYLRRCLREMAESHPTNGNGDGENGGPDTPTEQGNS